MNKCFLLAISLALSSFTTLAQAAIIQFDLKGKAGTGLLSSNENGVIAGTPGSGGEIGAGITFDTATNNLTINAAWGTANGFTNLTGTTTGGHLHGPTASAGVASYTENAAVKYPLDSLAGWNTSASAGGYSGTIAILPADVSALLAGQFYFNAHTSTNAGGEIRGNLVQVPEPASLTLLSLATATLLLRRRRA